MSKFLFALKNKKVFRKQSRLEKRARPAHKPLSLLPLSVLGVSLLSLFKSLSLSPSSSLCSVRPFEASTFSCVSSVAALSVLFQLLKQFIVEKMW